MFNHVKRLLSLGCPLEAVGFLQESIKGETSFAEVRDESAEGGEAPYDSLNPIYVLNQAHPCDGGNLLWVGFDATLGDNEADQHAPRDPKNTFFGIEFDVICPEFHKGSFKVDDKVVSSFGLNYDVVDVGLNGPPDEVPEAVEHTTLVSCPSIL